MSFSINSFHFTNTNTFSSGSTRFDYRLFAWQLFYTPSYFMYLDFLSKAHYFAFHFVHSFIDFHHYRINPNKENILSAYIHNHEFPLDKTSFPASLRLFFAKGNIEPP
jgi:hypothetical protein